MHSHSLRRMGSWLAVGALLMQLGVIAMHGTVWGESAVRAGSVHHLLHGHDHVAESLGAGASAPAAPHHLPGCPLCGAQQLSRILTLSAERNISALPLRISFAHALGASTTANAGHHVSANPRPPPALLSSSVLS